jgi:hypothetical protein
VPPMRKSERIWTPFSTAPKRPTKSKAGKMDLYFAAESEF